MTRKKHNHRTALITALLLAALTAAGCSSAAENSPETASSAPEIQTAGTTAETESESESKSESETESETASETGASASETETAAAESAETQSTDTAVSSEESASPKTASSDTASEEEASAVLYIGAGDSFQEYPISYTGTLSAELLISEISNLTGWNLDLSEEISSGKGGMTISFADTSSLIAGPPEEQKEEFFVFDVYDLTEKILDSVKRTIQYNFVDPELGDPNNLPVYFCLNGEDIIIPNTDISVSHLEPYNGLAD